MISPKNVCTMRWLNIVSIVFLQFILGGNCDNAPSVVIVGAGAAGISAASRLLENNFTNVKILEAEARIGGRIHSVKFGDAVVDLGAQWCHGQRDNVVYELTKELGLLENTSSDEPFYHSSHEHIDQNLVKELHQIFQEFYEGEVAVNEEISTGDYIIPRYNKSITERYGNDTKKLKFASEFLTTLAKSVESLDGCFSWFDISAKSDYQNCEGNQLMHWKGRGYKTILDVLMKTYPDSEKSLFNDDNMILNKEVTNIIWDADGENGASIECLDGSIYKADHVIFTPSLGVLKERYATLFHPQLPQEKIDAIEELGIDAVHKVNVHFSQRWWPAVDFNTILFWSENDRLELLRGSSNVPDKSDQSWLLDLVAFIPLPRNPNVLLAWFAGPSVPRIESFSDEQLVDGVMFTLNKFLGHQFENITKPDSISRFNWYSNPHFRGTYSYQTVPSRKREVSGEIALSKPLTSSNGKQVLLFAGEATNPIHYSTVHGAIETGFREADRIINLYK